MIKRVYGVVPKSGPILVRPSILEKLRSIPLDTPETLTFGKAFAATVFGALLGVGAFLFGLL